MLFLFIGLATVRCGTWPRNLKAWVFDRSVAGTAGSNPTGSMAVCLLWVLCVVRQRSLRRADYSPRGVLPSVCHRVKSWSLDRWIMRRPRPTGGCCALGENKVLAREFCKSRVQNGCSSSRTNALHLSCSCIDDDLSPHLWRNAAYKMLVLTASKP